MKKTGPSSNSRGSELPLNTFPREQYLYLTTRGRRSGLPREIEIWFIHRDGRLYVIAEYATSQWVQNVRANPEIQVRVAGKRFNGHARIVSPETESDLNRSIQDASREKYGWGEGIVVELAVSSAAS